MGKLEIQSAKRTRKGDMQRAVLMTVAAAGFLSMALLAPNALQALAKLGILDIRGKRRKELINRSRDRLLDAGLLMRDERGYLRLSPKGEAKLRQLELHNYQLKKPKRWDMKWRLLIFDIPERRRYTREKVRNTLQMIGFERLQDSAWVYPYDCEDLVTLLKVDFKIGKDLLYIITDGIENDLMLRKRFGLE